jgi:hypothetical protein
MTVRIAGIHRQMGSFSCYIWVEREDGKFYYLQKSVPLEEETDENIELWKAEALALATEYFNQE